MIEAIVVLLVLLYLSFTTGLVHSYVHYAWLYGTPEDKYKHIAFAVAVALFWPFIMLYRSGRN